MSDKDKQLETIAEQWVNLVLAHIESKKQKIKESAKAKHNKNEHK